ncbi:MAG: glycosyltransferase family 29 protein [Candidatus Binatia bacterium]|nr:glycosyltransferase family 29 protein [Candidatus Binatia bacterium]
MTVPYPLPALYWMWRQRALDIRTWEDVATDLPIDGARIAIVGNAGYLADLDQGERIDDNDLVLRMNNFEVSGFETAVGSRVDLYMSNFYVPDIDFTNPDIARARWILSSRPNIFRKPKQNNLDLRYGEQLTEGLERIGATTAYAPSLPYIQDVAAQLKNTPTTGMMALVLATDMLLPRCKSIYVTGFSFFEGKSHYFREANTTAFRNHNISSEKTILAKRLAPHIETGRVVCDPTVAKHLGFES